MARPIPHNNECSLFKIALIDHCLAKDRALRPRRSRLQWLLYTISLIFCHPSLADTRCDNSAATLESVEGVVEWTVTDGQWQQAARGDSFCYGDKIRVLEQRAALRLANDTVVRLRENSVVTLMPEEKGFWIELLQGAGHFLSRTPKQLTIKAAYLNAAIDGTEFVVITDDQRDRVAVFEGDVRVFNRYGEVRLTEGTETSATATTAPDPARSIRLRDAAEWILYYPPLIIQNQRTAEIAALMARERYADALKVLTQQHMTAEDASLAASLALVSGQPSEADRLISLALQQNPQSPDALALQALKTLTGGDDQTALSQTTALLQNDSQNVSVLLAHAYALQSQGKIEEALEVNRRALSLNPDNLFILARTAELELSTGNTRAARKLIDRALQKAPNHSRLNTLAGFIALNRFANKEAQAYFHTAINSNDSEPLARLGLALALIQKGKIEEGRAEMEMAVLLDPGSSLLRSYLGKTYAAQDQNDWADTQYQLAKNLDSNDPTPWFYQAHLKHEENKPGEALRLITTAIEKNDNRAVYRSRMLLDSDAAARSANQAQIYRSMWVNEKAHEVASMAVVKNPTEFSSHAAIAHSLESGNDLAAMVARANETLVTKLLMPIGADEFRIASNVVSTFEPSWLSPSRLGAHDHTSLFSEQGLNSEFHSFLGSQDSKGYEWQMKAIRKDVMMSGGQYFYHSNGHQQNNDFSTGINEVNFHWRLSESAKIFAQYNDRKESSGDVLYNIDSLLFDDSYRSENRENTIQLGGHIKISDNATFLFNTDGTHGEFSQSYFNSFFDTKIENHQASILGHTSTLSYQIGIHEEKYERKEEQDLPPETINFWREDTSSTIKIYSHLYLQATENITLFTSANHMNRRWELPLTERTDGTRNFKAGLHWQATKSLSLSTAYWTDTNARYQKYGSIENPQIFDILTKDFLFAFSRTENLSVSTNYSLHEKFFLDVNTTFSKQKPWFYLFDESQDPVWAEIQDFEYESVLNIGHISYLPQPNVTAYFRWRWLDQERQKDTYNWNFDEPLEYEFNSYEIGIKYTVIPNLSFNVAAENVHQDTTYDGFQRDDLYKYPANGTISHFNIRYIFNDPVLSFSLKILNLSDKKISVLERSLGAPDDYFSPLTANRFFYPPGRSILFTSSFKLD